MAKQLDVAGQAERNFVMASPSKPVTMGGTSTDWVATQDAAAITDPASEITSIDDRIVLVNGATIIRAHLGYDDGLTSITNPILVLYGRHGDDDNWRVLLNLNNARAATFTTAASTDVSDGTLNYTSYSDVKDFSWDVDGASQIVFGVETALAGTGTTTNAVVQLWGL